MPYNGPPPDPLQAFSRDLLAALDPDGAQQSESRKAEREQAWRLFWRSAADWACDKAGALIIATIGVFLVSLLAALVAWVHGF